MAKHHKQIEYVEPNTLIVGIDIGKSVHFVKMMLEGRQIAAFKLYNEGMSFMSLLDKIRQVEKHHQCAATLIGMEPTGHYRAVDDIYPCPLRQAAVDTLNRQLRSGIADETLAQLVIALRDDDRLCIVHQEDEHQEPQIICSMGLIGQ